VVETEAIAALDKFLDNRHSIGKLVALSGIYDALHVDGVKKVQLITPTEDVITTDEQAAYSNSKIISIAVDE
jgi:phage-related baseplate assembly protein